MSLKRAFTKEGGSLTTITDDLGVKDNAYKVALLIRLAVFIPVVVAVIGLLLSSFTDITFEQYLDAIISVKQVIGM